MKRLVIVGLALATGALAACPSSTNLTVCDGGEPDVLDAGRDAGRDLDAGALCVCPTEVPDAGRAVDGGHVEPDAGPPDAGTPDAGTPDAGELPDGGAACLVDGNPGQCMDSASCNLLPAFGSIAGYCPGPANIECCVETPDTANNPPVPTGWSLMQQANVTAEMTDWAVDILNEPVAYPRFSTILREFGTFWVLARVEWHPPDFQNSVVHRGVTLYQQ